MLFEPSSVQTVVFDFDGTLAATNIDFAEMRRRILEHLRVWALYQPRIEEGKYILEIVEWACTQLAQRPEDCQAYREQARAILEEIELDHCRQAVLFPGVAESLGQLKASDIRVGIISRNSRRGVAAVLSNHPLPHDVLLTRDDLTNVKPHREHLERALATLSTPPDRALMVGDHPTDIQCGQAAGVRTCGVLTARTTREEFHELGADYAFRDVPALVNALLDHQPL